MRKYIDYLPLIFFAGLISTYFFEEGSGYRITFYGIGWLSLIVYMVLTFKIVRRDEKTEQKASASEAEKP